jgi:zinc/manganese transport system substrate-binding protein
MPVKRLFSFIIGCMLACTVSPSIAADKLPVVVSFSILADVVQQVGGDHVTVQALVGPDADAHVFEPSPADVRIVSASRLMFINGLGFEGWLPRLVDAARYRGKVITATQGIEARAMSDAEDSGHDHHHIDPHVWQDPLNVVVYVHNIVDALSTADVANATYYRQRGDAYIAQLNQIDTAIRQQIAAITPVKRRIITSHDAFGYFGKRYGVTFISAQGVSTDSEPDAKAISNLIQQIRREQTKAIFFENMSNRRLLDQITQDAHAKIGGKLYADALSSADGPAANYLALIQYNANEIVSGLRHN